LERKGKEVKVVGGTLEKVKGRTKNTREARKKSGGASNIVCANGSLVATKQ